MKVSLGGNMIDHAVPLAITFSGWLFLLGYLYIHYLRANRNIIHLLTTGSDASRISTILILLAPLITSILGFVLDERLRRYRTNYQLHFQNLLEYELRETLDHLIVSFVNALDSKSPWTKGHSLRVQHYCLMIAKELKLPNDEVEQLSIAALLHDIGKIGTYDVILNKTEALSDEEYALIKKHPDNAIRILEPIKQFGDLLPIIRCHHERVDGKGYPQGLQGKQIPQLARVLCVADAFDAITSERPYKISMEIDQAILELRKLSGSQFDPDVVDALMLARTRPDFVFVEG